MAAVCCGTWHGAAVSWVRASVDRPYPHPEPRRKGNPPRHPRSTGGLLLPPLERMSAGSSPTLPRLCLSPLLILGFPIHAVGRAGIVLPPFRGLGWVR